MPPCRLPSPSALFSELHLHSSPDLAESSSYSININMRPYAQRPTSSSSSSDGQQLPGFSQLLGSLPESERSLPVQPLPSQSPTYQPSPRAAHVRHDPRWHPYSPPRGHRSFSRSTTPDSEADIPNENGAQDRTARPTYTEEEIYFIWYHKDDLGLQWPRIKELFNEYFNRRGRDGVQGIQCRYYRALDIHGIPKSRQRDRSLPNKQFGVRRNVPDRYWPWMN